MTERGCIPNRCCALNLGNQIEGDSMPYTPEPLPTYTFKNGAVATVHRIGQMTIAHIAAGAQKKFPAVPVPTFEVDMGAGPKQEPNPANPAYQQAVAERNQRLSLAVLDTLIELAVDIDIDQHALGKLKATLDLAGMPLEEISDKVAYIKHCCITDGSELNKISSLIKGELEEAVEAAEATFSGDLPGPAADTLESAEQRSALQLSV